MRIISNRFKYLFLVICISLLLVSCAIRQKVGPAKELTLDPDYKYKIEKVEVVEKEEYKVDAAKMMWTALEESLREKDLLWTESSKQNYYAISVQILDYDMGSAFKRWLIPGYGSTVLGVHTDVIDVDTGQKVSELEHRKTVAGGGLYSVGAWKTIFNTVATDIATDIERKYSGSGFTVKLDPWLKNETTGPDVRQSQEIRLLRLNDNRVEKSRIGERHAAFNVSMGDIYTNRDVAAYMTEALQNELLASGIKLTNNDKAVTLSGEVDKFWVSTDTTALYWDVIGEIEVQINATSPRTNKSISKSYKGQSTTRTYVWPSNDIVKGVVTESIKSIMYDIRGDRIWSTLH